MEATIGYRICNKANNKKNTVPHTGKSIHKKQVKILNTPI